jgi:hypothetical protein
MSNFEVIKNIFTIDPTINPESIIKTINIVQEINKQMTPTVIIDEPEQEAINKLSRRIISVQYEYFQTRTNYVSAQNELRELFPTVGIAASAVDESYVAGPNQNDRFVFLTEESEKYKAKMMEFTQNIQKLTKEYFEKIEGIYHISDKDYPRIYEIASNYNRFRVRDSPPRNITSADAVTAAENKAVKKYLKYKNKYLQLKKIMQLGGTLPKIGNIIVNNSNEVLGTIVAVGINYLRLDTGVIIDRNTEGKDWKIQQTPVPAAAVSATVINK